MMLGVNCVVCFEIYMFWGQYSKSKINSFNESLVAKIAAANSASYIKGIGKVGDDVNIFT